MNADYFVTFDRGHARVYRSRVDPAVGIPGLTLVDSVDLPEGKEAYTSAESDQAGRYPGSRGTAGGMGIDERLPMERERDRRVTGLIAEFVTRALQKEPEATWVCASGPDTLSPVIEQLEDSVRSRMKASLQKNLINEPLETVEKQFVSATPA